MIVKVESDEISHENCLQFGWDILYVIDLAIVCLMAPIKSKMQISLS